MKKERNQRPQRQMKPVFLVFYEGETEETYVNFLRQQYKLPIKIITHVTGQALSKKRIENYIKAMKLQNGNNPSSRIYLLLDEMEKAREISAHRSDK